MGSPAFNTQNAEDAARPQSAHGIVSHARPCRGRRRDGLSRSTRSPDTARRRRGIRHLPCDSRACLFVFCAPLLGRVVIRYAKRGQLPGSRRRLIPDPAVLHALWACERAPSRASSLCARASRRRVPRHRLAHLNLTLTLTSTLTLPPFPTLTQFLTLTLTLT